MLMVTYKERSLFAIAELQNAKIANVRRTIYSVLHIANARENVKNSCKYVNLYISYIWKARYYLITSLIVLSLSECIVLSF